MGDSAVELELSYSQCGQFVQSQTSQHQSFVDQTSLSAKRFESFAHFRLNFRNRLPLPLAPSHSQGVEQGSAAGDVEQFHKLGFGHPAPLASPVGPLVRSGDNLEGIERQSAGLDAPVREGVERRQVGIASPSRHPIFRPLRFADEPGLDGPAPQFAESRETAVARYPIQSAANS